jgi:lactate dehydrogenase-like 2-hydroxyacid dehydrogenase
MTHEIRPAAATLAYLQRFDKLPRNVRIVFPQALHDQLLDHLLRNDLQEHAAAILAGWQKTPRGHRLLVREIILAREPEDYRVGPNGFNALQATFIHRAMVTARDRRLIYIAAHNHGGRRSVAFSGVDLASHERGYPALRDIAEGMPVGGLVVADGAMEIDLWLPDGTRACLDRAEVVGARRTLYHSSPRTPPQGIDSGEYSRQELFLGAAGQTLLRESTVAVVGLGGVGSIVNELLARLGVGRLILIDSEAIEPSNFSRIVGSTPDDIAKKMMKVAIAARVAQTANPKVNAECIENDIARASVARRVLETDYIFLAADSMRARLVFNAIVQQYLVPGVQMGTKIAVDAATGAVRAAHSSVRHVSPRQGCLMCNELIDLHQLADEWKTNQERQEQWYGMRAPNPSVVTMNAVVAAHAVNDFLMYFVGLADESDWAAYRRFDHLSGKVINTLPRRDEDCVECGVTQDSRYAMGDAAGLPCAEG